MTEEEMMHQKYEQTQIEASKLDDRSMFDPSKLADITKLTKKDVLDLKTTMVKQEWEVEDEGANTQNEVCPNVEAKYEMIQKMGKGNYGIVWKAIDKRNRERVAVKKINNAFANKIDAMRTLREIQIMFEMGKHPNLMGLHTVRIGKNHKDIYLVFELMEADLHTVIRGGICTNE